MTERALLHSTPVPEVGRHSWQCVTIDADTGELVSLFGVRVTARKVFVPAHYEGRGKFKTLVPAHHEYQAFEKFYRRDFFTQGDSHENETNHSDRT